MEDTLAFDRAVAKAMEMVDVEDTLVVVSADHSHTFTVSGYASFEESIMGRWGCVVLWGGEDISAIEIYVERKFWLIFMWFFILIKWKEGKNN